MAITKKYLPSSAIKALRAQITPLAHASLPEPDDLRDFWRRCEAAILLLGEDFEDFQTKIGEDHINKFGPYLLGFAGWQQVEHRQMRSWY